MPRNIRNALPVAARRNGDWRILAVRVTLLVFATLLLAGCRSQPSRGRSAAFDFIQMCDPQIGFTEYAADLERFEQAVNQINGLNADLVAICGDLVNAPNKKSFGDFMAAKSRLRVPVYLAPGNHDIGSPSAETLERYRRLVGKDYYAVDHKGCTFVVVNSQLWKTPLAVETEAEDTWLMRTLKAAAKQQQRVFVVMHHPLFVKEPDEPDNYFNIPIAKRRELLRLFERYGVVAVLAGHTHTTATHNFHGIQMVTSENTSRNFDQRPCGFRIWHVGPERPYQNEFVPLASAQPPQQ